MLSEMMTALHRLRPGSLGGEEWAEAETHPWLSASGRSSLDQLRGRLEFGCRESRVENSRHPTTGRSRPPLVYWNRPCWRGHSSV